MDSITNKKLLIKHLQTKNEVFELDLSPEQAGWKYSGLKVYNLLPNVKKEFNFENSELCILPLNALNITVNASGKKYILKGRENVFLEQTDFLFIPLNTKFDIYSENGGKIAFPYSKCSKQYQVEYVSSDKIKTDIIGVGQASRQRNSFCTPSCFSNADKLCSLEVITPAGNWSSYPPHKHDTESECEAELEEIYYFLIDDPKGFAFMRTYTKDGTIDATETVRNGDLFIVPRGYHGPCVVPPGFNLYQINVMAGPAEKRSMDFCDDPDYKFIRDEWTSGKEVQDIRLPLSKAGCQVNY